MHVSFGRYAEQGMESNLIGHIGDLVFAVDGLLGLLRRRDLSVLDFLLIWPGVEGLFEGAFEDLDSLLDHCFVIY